MRKITINSPDRNPAEANPSITKIEIEDGDRTIIAAFHPKDSPPRVRFVDERYSSIDVDAEDFLTIAEVISKAIRK